ncbi:MAG: type II toxin-antitoxin system prevent-host-death family antitoxin [Bryobacteraceae bacterium]
MENSPDIRIPAADANRQFSKLLREVKNGRSVVVTSHGRPVAKIVPYEGDEAELNRARNSLFARLEKERVVAIGRWRREDLYDDAQ